MMRTATLSSIAALVGSFAMPFTALAQPEFKSHPPLRTIPAGEKRPMPKGPHHFVDPIKGSDTNTGTEQAPWKTLRRGLKQLRPGATLLLRGGIYYENVAVSKIGNPDAPITIRSYPGEQAIVDGSLREFFEAPAKAWEHDVKLDGGTIYRSAKLYPNLRTVLGWFGDSLIGLHTYHHNVDLNAANEWWDLKDPSNPKGTDVKPVYCGPGVWYEPLAGRIYCRLSHTHLPDEPNYKGVSDARQLPLIIAPFRSVPLHIDGARHVRFQDLVIRGGGYDTVVIDQASDIEFDNVTVWCGTYGLRATGAQRLKLYRSGFHGSLPPWTFRTDTSLRSYGDTVRRDITRLGTHAILVHEAGREFSVYAYPVNDDWDISYCDFTDAHDGLYFGAVNVRFHHNQLIEMQDDGVYLSPMYPRYGKRKAELHLFQNYFGKSLTPLAFGGPEKMTGDTVFIYRNVFDVREPLRTARPSSTAKLKGRSYSGHVMGDHGGPPWSQMRIYHNTFVLGGGARTADMGLLSAAHAERPRHFFNNILLHPERLSGLRFVDPELGQSDGNLYWAPVESKKAAAQLAKYRASQPFEKSKKGYSPGFESRSLIADPKLDFKAKGLMQAFRLPAGSPAIDAGATLPVEWPDPLRQLDKDRPDIGALPVGVELRVGRQAPPER